MLRRLAVGLAFLGPGLISPSAQVVINEIHANPDVKTELVEFIELHNAGNSSVNLSGWQLAEAVEFTFPSGTTLPAGGYMVVGQNPAALQSKFGAAALGPWSGRLASDGERILLRNASGGVEDEVTYQLGFPWPTVGDPPGYSIELVNPAFDNDLGGNWRASTTANPTLQNFTLIPDHSAWKYFKGLSEASAPTTAWRALNFPDGSWPSGSAPIGYGESANFLGTILSDMRSNYTTVYFRKTFVVTNVAQITALSLEAVYDDGFKVWINGSNVLNANITSGDLAYDGTSGPSREDLNYNTFNLSWPQTYLVPGTNVIAIHAANLSLTTSSDFFLDVRLLASAGPAARGPTPGAINSVFATNLPPAIRQVDHSPEQPVAGEPVTITAKVTDANGVSGVTLSYQLVDPGNYIELTDAAYANNWTNLAMNDAGQNGDALAGDSVYTAVLPGNLLTHRWLVRYRIAATDGVGLNLSVPYPDDPQPNFALFCYNGVPAWTGAVQPGVTANFTVSSNEMNRLPVYQLISKRSSVLTATGWNPGAPNNKYTGDNYLWRGTFVYDGKVYDHISYRMRGGVWRYAMGKNAWKFAFNRGHNFQARDDWGRPYNSLWRRMSFRPDIQQGDYLHRGEQGMFESVGYKLFRLAGADAPLTTHVQFRIVDDAPETTPGNQYESDFWGLYLVVEEQDGRFLEERGLPDGNVYDMESGTGTLNNTGPNGPLDKSDLNTFLNTYNNTTPSEAWWRTNLNLPQYYSYQTILQGFHHYDIADGKNYFYYRNPAIGQWTVWPWDLDLSWADNMYRAGVSGGNEPFKSRVLSNFSATPAYPALAIEFRNRVREIRDLLFNTDQAYQVIDEMAALIRGPAGQPSIIDADRSQWDYNPVMVDSAIVNLSKAGQGRFYRWEAEPSVTKDFNGCIQMMKNYIVYRATSAALASGVFGLDGLAADTIPNKPTLNYIGGANYPVNRLSFRSSAYSGSQAFAAMKWRIGEVTDTNAPAFDPNEPRFYEINAVWESPELAVFNSDITIPSGAVKIGHAYRVRVKVKDVTGRWSNWSGPAQFITAEPDNAAALVDNLRVTEVMYNPPAGSDFEFVELHNTSTNLTLNLDGVNFTSGIDLTFSTNTSMPPGSYLLVARAANLQAFRAHYGLSTNVPLVGPYSGGLANEGEILELKTGAGGTQIFSFDYGDGRGWPVAADGAGHSLIPLDRAVNGQATGGLDYPGNWRASVFVNGSPGQAEPTPVAPTVLLNELTAHTDYDDPSRPEYDSNDWIELFNPTGEAVSLTNWYLSDDATNLKKWAIPNVTVPARGWIAFDEITGFHNPITTGFGLDKAGEQILLSHLPGSAADRVVDAIAFKGQQNEVSLGRRPDGASFWYTMPRTRDAVNGAGFSDVVITELMYHPPDSSTNDNTRDEFVELVNPLPDPVTLQDSNGVWRLDGGISFDFPAGAMLPAGGSLLVVSFAPTNTATLDQFRAVHGITNLNLPILGPYSGKLGNRSDRVALEKPQLPDAPGDAYSWVIVDEVIYGNQQPWPTNANGGGPSLQRLSVIHSGRDPVNWAAAQATPGYASLDWDGDRMPNYWEILHGLRADDPVDAGQDADGDGLTNLQEYQSDTDPHNANSRLQFDSVSATGAGVILKFTAMPDRSYSIQFCTAPAGGLWLTLTNLPAAANTQSVAVPDALNLDLPARFYRLVTPGEP